MSERYPGYDVLSKRNTPSWNAQTRRVVDARVATPVGQHSFLSDVEFATLLAVCERIVPQPRERARPAPVAALIDEKLTANRGDGYRAVSLPPLREAWRLGLAAIESEACARHGASFATLSHADQDALLRDIQLGKTSSGCWKDMNAAHFFKVRVLHDVVTAYYSDPQAWSDIGFGGPASPRGYVRMNFDRRDPWEAAEARPGQEHRAAMENQRVGR